MRLPISLGSWSVAFFAFAGGALVGVSCVQEQPTVGPIELPGFVGAGGTGGGGGRGGSGGQGALFEGDGGNVGSSSQVSGPAGAGGSVPTADCLHGFCETGPKLMLGCDPCVTQVCGKDKDCCEMFWGDACVSLADQLCNAGCCGDSMCLGETCTSCPQDCGACVCGDGLCNGTETCSTCADDCGPCPACPHAVCATGNALDPAVCRDACVDEVCAMKPACCSTSTGDVWDGTCSQLADKLCDGDPCVTSVCASMPSCCATGWTQACVDEAKKSCTIPTPAGSSSPTCACGTLCTDGPRKVSTCDPCVEAICVSDPYCCEVAWDANCVKEVGEICGIVCD